MLIMLLPPTFTPRRSATNTFKRDFDLRSAILVLLCFFVTSVLLPLPKTGRDFRWQSMAQLPRQHAELTAMVCLVGHEVAEKVHKVRWEVLPRGRRDRATAFYAEPDQSNNSFAATLECARQLCLTNGAPNNPSRNFDAMARADHLDPHAPGVMNMRRDGPNCATRHARNTLGPQLRQQVFDKIHGYAMARAPRVDQGLVLLHD